MFSRFLPALAPSAVSISSQSGKSLSNHSLNLRGVHPAEAAPTTFSRSVCVCEREREREREIWRQRKEVRESERWR